MVTATNMPVGGDEPLPAHVQFVTQSGAVTAGLAAIGVMSFGAYHSPRTAARTPIAHCLTK